MEIKRFHLHGGSSSRSLMKNGDIIRLRDTRGWDLFRIGGDWFLHNGEPCFMLFKWRPGHWEDGDGELAGPEPVRTIEVRYEIAKTAEEVVAEKLMENGPPRHNLRGPTPRRARP